MAKSSKTFLDVIWDKVSNLGKTIPDDTSKQIDEYWDLTRQREAEVYPLLTAGALLEATQPIEAHYHTGGNNWMDTHHIQPGTKFLIEERPEMHEFGMYHVVVLVDGTKALVDLYELHDKITIVG